MNFVSSNLAGDRPNSLNDFSLPRRESFFPSSSDWRNEVLYFLLPDRFSDGNEGTRPLLDPEKLSLARPTLPGAASWRFDDWAKSGSDRWQGGTLKGLTSKLDYLDQLGITTIWVGPIFQQRGHLDSYHGYGIQDFLEVDPRFGTRQDLVELVNAAHERGLRIILDIIFNHSGSNWNYPPGTPGGEQEPDYTSGFYRFGSWLGNDGQNIAGEPGTTADGVWPSELQNPDCYTRAGKGDLGRGELDDPNAEFRRSDFISLRDFQLDFPHLLDNLARCYKYWIALTDCDGFRIDTLKHVTYDQARNFCGTIKEFATNLGKNDFFLVGEIAGGDYNADRYLDVVGQNLNAALDIGEMRGNLNQVAKGLIDPRAYFDGFDPGKAVMGSHRNLGRRHVSILDDHDHVFGEKIRFSSEAASDHQVVAGVALQLFTLGVPCIYAGTEQALAGPEPSERRWLPDWKTSDRYLREAMFGPEHPRSSGVAGLTPGELDETLPGFGPFGTAGSHCFNPSHPTYVRIAALTSIRKKLPILRLGRQYLRPISIPFLSLPFGNHGRIGEIIAWSRLLDDEEAVCVLNSNGINARGARVLVDPNLNPIGSQMTVILNTAHAADPAYAGPHQNNSTLLVQSDNGIAYVEIQPIPASEFLILSNHSL